MNILSCCFFSNNGKSEQIELTSIGVNTTLGIALFTIISHVAKYVAGPAVCISIIIAGLVAFVTGIFYSELYKSLTCKHLPSFVTLTPPTTTTTTQPSIFTTSPSQSSFRHIFNDSLIAFSIGWHLIFEYIIAISIASKTIGYFLDNLIENVIRIKLETVVPMNTTIDPAATNLEILSNYFDFFGFSIAIILFLSMCLTIKIPRLKIIDKFMLCITISAVIFIVIAAAFNANINNWQIDPIPPAIIDENNKILQNGFAPYGIFGIIKGSAIFTFIFIGLDSLLLKSNNQHILTKTTNYCSRYATFVIILCSTIGCAITITMMIPFYELNEYASIPDAFYTINLIVAQWIVAIGGILILVICAWRQLSSLKQIIGIMIIDGLLIKRNKLIILSITTSLLVNRKIERSILIALTIAVLMSSLFAGLFSIIQLIYLLSIGALILFLGISIRIICFRFSNEDTYGSMSTIDIVEHPSNNKEQYANHNNNNYNRKSNDDTNITCGQILKQLFCFKYNHKPSSLSFKIVKILLSLFIISSLVFGLMIRLALANILNIEIWAVTISSIALIVIIITILFILLQPTRIMSTTGISIRLVPLVAPINIFVICFLIAMLDFYAWIRFAVWSLIGLLIYILVVRPEQKQRKQLEKQQANTIAKTSIEKNDQTTSRSTSFFTLNSNQSIPNLFNDNLENDDEPNTNDTTIENHLQNHTSITIENQNMTKQSSATLPNDLPIASSTITTNTITDTILIENELTKNEKSNTPSPSNSLARHSSADDEIILAEDIIDTLSERKEPNGKIYYVYDKSKASSIESVSSSTQKEQIVADMANDDQVLQSINALDDVLSATEQNFDIIDNQNSKRIETSTVAIIHLPNEYQLNNNELNKKEDEVINNVIPTQQSPMENRKKLSLNLETPEPDYDIEIPSPDYDDEINDNKPIITTKSSQPNPDSVDEKSLNINSYEFKERLTALLGQNRFLERPRYLKAKAPQPPVQLPKTDILSNHLQYPPNQNSSRVILPIKSSVTNGNSDQHNGGGGVPEAPAFNATIYNTIGRQYSRQQSLIVANNNFDKPSNKSEVVLRRNRDTNNDENRQTNNVDIDNDADDDDEKKQLQRMSSIKDKLENIFRRGPIDRSSRTTKSIPIPVVPEQSPTIDVVSNENDNPQSTTDVNIEQNDEILPYKQVNKSMDTIGRQKLIYKDVLKSINNVIGSNENDGNGSGSGSGSSGNEMPRETNNNHF